jgi:hypothetical protein
MQKGKKHAVCSFSPWLMIHINFLKVAQTKGLAIAKVISPKASVQASSLLLLIYGLSNS